MTQWKTALAQGALAGSVASLFSTAVLAMAGRRETGVQARVYAALAIGLAAGALALRDQNPEKKKITSATQAAEEAQEEPPVIRRVRAGHA